MECMAKKKTNSHLSLSLSDYMKLFRFMNQHTHSSSSSSSADVITTLNIYRYINIGYCAHALATCQLATLLNQKASICQPSIEHFLSHFLMFRFNSNSVSNSVGFAKNEKKYKFRIELSVVWQSGSSWVRVRHKFCVLIVVSSS